MLALWTATLLCLAAARAQHNFLPSFGRGSGTVLRHSLPAPLDSSPKPVVVQLVQKPTTESAPACNKGIKPLAATRAVNERFPSAVLFGPTCGGTIISDRWVLTSAHCTLFTSGRYILAGTNNTADNSGLRVSVKKLYIHPLFTVGPYWLDAKRYGIKQVAARYDFMLAELEKPIPLDGVKIAAATLEQRVPEAWQEVGYAGFGAEHHGETMRTDMHGMELSTLGDAECASRLPQFNPEDMLCARGRPPKLDTACNGDSGSGLVTAAGALLGVASWVENDAFECRNGNIVVFARLTAALPWINEITGLLDQSHPNTMPSSFKNIKSTLYNKELLGSTRY